MPPIDWLSHLLKIMAVTGRLEVRCVYGAPWRNEWAQAAANEMPYHVILKGRALLENANTGEIRELAAGDIVLLPHGAAHVLHDGSGLTPGRTFHRHGLAGWLLSENDGAGEQLDLLCGRFSVGAPHDRLVRHYLPGTLVVSTADGADGADGADREASAQAAQDAQDAQKEASVSASHRLASLVGLMRAETVDDEPGGLAMLNALSAALFTLFLRAASKAGHAPTGLLALAGHPRLAPALSAMFANPAHPWSLQELSGLCSMSRATFMRHFQDKLSRSAMELLTDIRMSLAANALREPMLTTEAVAESVGYQSVSAFRRVFIEAIGMTPGQWRRLAREGQSFPPPPPAPPLP